MALRTESTDFAATEYSIYVSFHDHGLTRFREVKFLRDTSLYCVDCRHEPLNRIFGPSKVSVLA